LGFNLIKIEKNAKIIIQDENSKAIINGPCEFTCSDYSCLKDISNLEIREEVIELIKPKGFNRSLVGLLNSISKNILRIINDLCINLNKD